mmetsp:Transcript_4449/g.14409  ORF Transcript_4449/g.14409 Transcript_4449/m.14409 type:complete len:244 (-) Transcript_4449:1205-1936(-)
MQSGQQGVHLVGSGCRHCVRRRSADPPGGSSRRRSCRCHRQRHLRRAQVPPCSIAGRRRGRRRSDGGYGAQGERVGNGGGGSRCQRYGCPSARTPQKEEQRQEGAAAHAAGGCLRRRAGAPRWRRQPAASQGDVHGWPSPGGRQRLVHSVPWRRWTQPPAVAAPCPVHSSCCLRPGGAGKLRARPCVRRDVCVPRQHRRRSCRRRGRVAGEPARRRRARHPHDRRRGGPGVRVGCHARRRRPE